MSNTQRNVDVTLIDAAGNESDASLSCVLHVPEMGLQDWMGMGWVRQDIAPGDYQIRDDDGNEGRILVNKATPHFGGVNGMFTTIEFLGNGEIPPGWLR